MIVVLSVIIFAQGWFMGYLHGKHVAYKRAGELDALRRKTGQLG